MDKEFMKKKLLILTFVLFYSVNGISQITITKADLAIPIGSSINEYFDNSQSNLIQVGPTGGPQEWVFSEAQFPGGKIEINSYLNKSDTPYESQFPDADYAYYNPGEDFITDIYVYYKLTDNGLMGLGIGVPAKWGAPELIFDYTPDDLEIKFPLTFGESWNNNYSYSYNLEGGMEIKQSESLQNQIDAWGTIQLPIGTFECLRMRSHRISTEETLLNDTLVETETDSSIVYGWIIKDYGLVASTESIPDNTDPNFSEPFFVSFVTDINTFIKSQNDVLNLSYELAGNYPNPFNPSTTIDYKVVNPSHVQLVIYDYMGREVSTFVNEEKTAGSYSVSWNGKNKFGERVPSGVYLYTLYIDGRSVSTRKMLLLK